MIAPCKLLVVDDSKIMRRLITEVFDSDDKIEVVGEAADGIEALNSISRLAPDVITLDITMPGMDGLTTLKHLMIRGPKPTVMLSNLTREGERTTFDALRYGAVDFIAKPTRLEGGELEAQAQDIIAKVNLAAAVALESVCYIRATPRDKAATPTTPRRCDRVVAFGAAEGAYGALLKIIPRLRPDLPTAYLAVLYAPPPHVEAFARYLDDYSSVRVKRAVDGEPVEAGVCYLGAGAEYLTMVTRSGRLVLQVHPAPFVSRRGSIDRLLFSVAEAMKGQAAGVVLSGSGEDGSEGLEEIHRMGGVAIVQIPQSCLHKGMAHAALARCKPDFVLADVKIAAALNGLR
ncbi:MAG: chemotaxis protein CheB [Candidatus Contendobacter sp.]|nr:chemotaxis protein CheB [Candidatus Contendobacter sp.]MDG4556730.1 chemotaxis protein CheB [Candidatus Contendobacter sp.]